MAAKQGQHWLPGWRESRPPVLLAARSVFVCAGRLGNRVGRTAKCQEAARLAGLCFCCHNNNCDGASGPKRLGYWA